MGSEMCIRDSFYFYPHFGVDMKGQPVMGRWVDRFLSDAQQNLAARGESWRSTLAIIYRRGKPIDTLTGDKQVHTWQAARMPSGERRVWARVRVRLRVVNGNIVGPPR